MGFSKKTGKGRLDKYYYLAKEHGYRARSAFKVKQLDKKFGFLKNARVLLDLCAAPGGWLQVATESMPMSHVIIGVDLVPIKPIKGVTTIVGDITTDKCRSELKKELKTWKADVVLHDGAPNVGNSWIQDAFSQAELVLHSFKLASEFLIEGGVFVTKVFRSKEYPLVLCALKKYFKKVEATKPESSRSVSAEIFVYCKGFDAKYAKENPVNIREILTETNLTKANPLTNILHPEKKRVNRDGYEDDVTILHKLVTMTDYLNSRDPETILATFNAIAIVNDDETKYVETLKESEDIKIYCKDLKVIGRKEFKALLKLHKKFNSSVGTGKEDKIKPSENSNEILLDSDTELFNELKSHQRALKKKNRRLAKTLEESQNHIDISFDQVLEDEEFVEPIKETLNLSEDEWFSNPMFGEILDEFKESNSSEPKKTEKKKSKCQPVIEEEISGPVDNQINNADPDELVDISFNRYAFNDDKSTLPEWFVQDESLHNVPQEPITKEIVNMLKEQERLIKDRLPKKVQEAKNRQKMKAFKKLQTMKKKAAVIADNEDIGDSQKISQIRKLLSKAKVEKSKPKVVVAKGKLRALKGRPKGIKGKYKMVDKRMLKDIKKQSKKK